MIDFSAISVILTAVSSYCSPLFLSWLNVPPEAMEEATTYMRICSLGIPLIIGYNIICALLRAMGDSKSPLIFVGIACVINIICDVLLTGVLGMGVAGVAISTVAAQGLGFLFSLVFITRRGMSFPFSIRDIRYEKRVSASIFKIGVPMGVQSVLLNISFMFITAIINEMGVTASAAMGIGDKIVSFTFMPQSAFSASVAVIVAQNYGAKHMDRARLAVRYAIGICVAIESVCLLICMLFPDFLPSLFTNDMEVIGLAGLYMKAYCIDCDLVQSVCVAERMRENLFQHDTESDLNLSQPCPCHVVFCTHGKHESVSDRLCRTCKHRHEYCNAACVYSNKKRFSKVLKQRLNPDQ